MNLKIKEKTKVKKGAASIYIVTIISLVFSIVAFSFARLILSETKKTSNMDLSQSALDSANAGVEDAKIAISKCYMSGRTLATCEHALASNSNDCNHFVGYYGVYRSVDPEDGSAFVGGINGVNQSYTCTVITSKLPDYRSSLNNEEPIRMVSLSSDNVNALDSVQISWQVKDEAKLTYSDYNYCSSTGGVEKCFFPSSTNEMYPSVLSVSLLQPGDNYSLDKLLSDNQDVFGTVVLYPFKNGGSEVSVNQWKNAMNPETENGAIPIKCFTAEEHENFVCSAKMKIPMPTGERSASSTFLIVSLPYSDTQSTDFMLEMFDASGKRLYFNDAQAKIDSTGRANDLYRRVETRIDLTSSDINLPLYALEARGNGVSNSGGIKKGYYVTRDCLRTIGFTGTVTGCSNSAGT